MNTIDKMIKNHEEALAFIRRCQTNDDEPEMKAITNFLLETEDNLYGFLPEELAGSINSTCEFQSLLFNFHHALYDDGEICFPIISGEPMISFIDYHDNDGELTEHIFEQYVGCGVGKYYKEDKLTLCKDIFDFIEKRKEYFENSIKKCFINDSAMIGVEFAVLHYSKYSFFDVNWLNDTDELTKAFERRNALSNLKLPIIEPSKDEDINIESCKERECQKRGRCVTGKVNENFCANCRKKYNNWGK